MTYYVIGDQDTVLGFGLVGVDGIAVHGAEEARAAFDQALKTGEIGIVVITERVAEMIRAVVDRYVFTEDFPLILEIPDRTGTNPDRPGIRSLVNQAIGINL